MSNVEIVFSARPTQTAPARPYRVTDVQYCCLLTLTAGYVSGENGQVLDARAVEKVGREP